MKVREKRKARIFLVDDDTLLLSTATVMLESVQYECVSFTDAIDCLVEFNPRNCDLLVTDVRIPGIDGIELLHRAKRIAPWIPIIIMTSYADIPIAVQALKEGAFDFIEKPFEIETFLHVIELGLEQNQLNDATVGKPLTETEKIVLQLILQDKTSNEVAGILDRSVRTIEVHRNHIMHKLDVHCIVNLVKRAVEMGLNDAC